MSRFATLKNAALGAVLVSSFVVGGSAVSLAQDTTEAVPSHPAHIHAGDCANPDPNPAAPLVNVTVRQDVEDEDAEDTDNAPVGTLTSPTVLYSDSEEIDLSFEDDVLASAHSIIVHESDENIQNYVACADIGGVVVDDELVVSLQPLNDSGYTGIVKLSADDDGKVDVEIFLAEPATPAEAPATPAA